MAQLFKLGSLAVNLNDPWQNLLLLVLLFVLTTIAYLYMVYARRKRATHFGNMKLLQKVHGYKRFHINPGILLFKLFIIGLLFLIATESVELRQTKIVSDADYMILLDSSSSMTRDDYPPNRLQAAKEISSEWLKMVPDTTKIGLIAFAQEINVDTPLTLDRNYLREQIDAIKVDYGQSGTALDFAINYALNSINMTDEKVTFLLLTDGTQNVDNVTVAKAKARGVKIYSFGIGSANVTTEDSEYYTSLDFNFTILEDLSQRTGAKAYEVSGRQELDQALREATLEDAQISLNTNYYILLLIAGLSILEFVLYSRFGGL